MKKPPQPMKAVVVSEPRICDINDIEALAYEAEMEYVRKEPEVKYILCTPLDDVRIGDSVDLVYNVNMRSYQHKYASRSNNANTIGGFYYTNGRPA